MRLVVPLNPLLSRSHPMMTVKPEARYPIRRLIIGVISIVCLAIAATSFLVFGVEQSKNFTIGICVRLGLFFFAVWLAWNQLSQIADRLPQIVLWAIVIAALVVVVRRQLFPIAATLIAAGLAVHFGLRFLRSGLR